MAHWHWQNLNERRTGADGETPTDLPWRGRAWLHWGSGSDSHIEWSLGGILTGFSFSADEDGWHFMFAVPLLALFFGINTPRLRGSWQNVRELSLRVHDWAIWWKTWSARDEWNSKTPRWRHGCFHIDDFFLGKAKHSTRVLAWRWVAVPMPERTYYGCACLEEATWKRSRWVPLRITHCRIDMLPGEQIGHPGKGENSWDCGDDATFGLSGPARSIEEGIANLVGSVLRSRTKYGGHDWSPVR